MSPDDSFSSQELADVLAKDSSDEDDSLTETIAAAFKTSEEGEKPADASSEASDDDATKESGETEGQDSDETSQEADSEETGDTAEPDPSAEALAKADETGDKKTDQTKDGEDDPAALPAIEPPARFSEKDKDTFRSLPREAQEILAARNQEMEADYTRKTTDLAEQRKATEALQAAVEPYRPYLASLNTTPDRAIPVLLAADYQLRHGTPEQKNKLIVQLAHDYGISLSEISELSEDDAVAPEIAQVNQRIAGIERAIQVGQTQAQTQINQSAENQVTAFVEEKDSAGNLLHPHFAEVRAVMGSLISVNPDLDVHKAYEHAVWANPQLREANLSQQRQEAEKATEQRRVETDKKAETERKEKVQKAKKAGTRLKGGAEPPGPGAKVVEESLRDTIKKEFAAASSS